MSALIILHLAQGVAAASYANDGRSKEANNAEWTSITVRGLTIWVLRCENCAGPTHVISQLNEIFLEVT